MPRIKAMANALDLWAVGDCAIATAPDCGTRANTSAPPYIKDLFTPPSPGGDTVFFLSISFVRLIERPI
jgi:hypothetical protein